METWIEPAMYHALQHIGCQRGLSADDLVVLAVREFLASMDDEEQCSCAGACQAELQAAGTRPELAGSFVSR